MSTASRTTDRHGAAGDDGTAGVTRLLIDWARHELAGDVGAIAGLLAPRFVGIGPVGFVLDSRQWPERHRGDLVNRRFELTDVEMQSVGDVVVGRAVVHQETTAMGRDTSGSFRLGFVAAPVGVAGVADVAGVDGVAGVAHGDDSGWVLVHVQLSGPMIRPGQAPPFATEADRRAG